MGSRSIATTCLRREYICLWIWLLVVACVNLVPRQGWDPARGPVVPHDTFPADCALCHEGGDWSVVRADFEFDHERETGHALEGAHADASGLMCHNDRGPVAMYAARGCGGCHADVHQRRLGSDCSTCHDQQTWLPREQIAKHDMTRFPLVGAHASAACFRCHPGAQVGNFAGTPVECAVCHAQDYAATTAPNHAQVGYAQDCEMCHLETGWQPARFDHPGSFPLERGHFGLACAECHETPGVFAGLSTDCGSCHDDDHQAVTDPSHLAAGFGLDCEQCHDTRLWSRVTWTHPTGFELTFGHAGRRCSQCHVGQSYVGTGTECVSCHLPIYEATQNPSHVTAGFGQDCESCHNTAIWQGATVDHPASFPLENAHRQACATCHQVVGTYAGLDPSCASCHLPDFQTAIEPNHVTAGFGTDCQTCHGTTAWQGATFVHPASFPLQNAHQVACAACHQNGVYQGLDPSCVACHMPNYQATNDPPHGAFQLSTQCEQCHATLTWGTAPGWQHAFPITSGDHAGMTCFDCHTNPANRTAFSCIACHEHNQQEMADEHDRVSGYLWVSASCYGCHPSGQK
jgi:hypothetical protein